MDVFYDITSSPTVSNLQVTNNIFEDIASIGDAASGFVFDYNDFYNSWTTGIGTNDINVDPQLDANYVPGNAALTVAPRMFGVETDYDGDNRNDPTTIGAKKHASE